MGHVSNVPDNEHDEIVLHQNTHIPERFVMRFMGRTQFVVSITAVALLAGCAGGSAARSPWRVQRVQPWPASPMKPVAPQPQTAAPNAVSPRSGTAPPVTEKLVPLPTVDPQAKSLQKLADPETTVQPQIRFKPAPLGSSSEGESIVSCGSIRTLPRCRSLRPTAKTHRLRNRIRDRRGPSWVSSRSIHRVSLH